MLIGHRKLYGPGSSLRRFACYCAVGGINTVADLSIFAVLISLVKAAPAPANIVSYTTALCISFLLNRNFTFRSSGYDLRTSEQFGRFVVVNLVCLCGSTVAVWVLAPRIGAIAAKLAIAPFVAGWGFIAVRWAVFRGSGDGPSY